MHGSRRRGLGTEQPGDGHWDGTTVRETGGTRRPQVLPPGKATAPVSDPPHAHLREGPQGRSVLDQAHHDREADAGEAATDQGRVEATPAPATPGTGHVAEEGPPGPSQPLRSPRQLDRDPAVPNPDQPALAAVAAATQPTWPPVNLGEDERVHQPMDTPGAHPAPIPGRAFRSQNPRQEPSAVVPHAGN